MADFLKAFAYTLQNEGGDKYTDILGDEPTKYGITLPTLKAYMKEQGLNQPTKTDVQNLTFDLAQKIATKNYWNPLGLSDISDQALAQAIFDIGFNCGVETAAKLIQTCLNVKADGFIGPATKKLINCQAESKSLLISFISHAQGHYIEIVQNNPSKIQFLKGWINRTQRLMTLIVV